MKLFELEVPVLRASKELGLAYNTVHRLFTLIREHIYKATSEDSLLSREVDESYFGGRRKGNRMRFFEQVLLALIYRTVYIKMIFSIFI